MKATVFGATGFIGSRLSEHLRSLGYEVSSPSRAELQELSGDLGLAFYCIGMTGNFRRHPKETVAAQVTQFSDIIGACNYSTLVYLSSTRVYGSVGANGAVDECTPVKLLPSADMLYDISKLLGEALCAATAPEKTIVARLSNVVGVGMSENTFLGSVLTSIVRKGSVAIGEAPDSAKDYVRLDDVVNALAQLAIQGESGVFNIASGKTVSHQAIAEHLRAMGYEVDFREEAKKRAFPIISIDKIRTVCDFQPQGLLDGLQDLILDTTATANQ